MSKLGIGVVGVGEMGRRHAENLRRLVSEAQLIAIADLDGARAAKVAAELEIEHSYNDFEAMLERRDIQAVVIATPDKFHTDAVQAAARAGKNIFCEKPLGLDTASGRAALDAVKDAGVGIQVGFMRRYDAAHVLAKRQIAGGEIGEPVIFKSIGRDKDMPPLAAYQSGINGTLFYTNSIHDFDSARWLMNDEVSEVHSFTTVAIRPELAEYDDVVASSVNLRFQRGAIGNIESYTQCLYGYDVRTEIVGSKGTILIGTLRNHSATLLTSSGGTHELADHFLARFRDAYVAQLIDFVHNLLHDLPLFVTGEDGLRALEIAAAAEESHRKRATSSIRATPPV
jgi:scyllo-inositol 2-dehydrogenase (NAD+)